MNKQWEFTAIKEARKWRRKYSEAMSALESLTPGGSEYVGDPERCVAAVRTSREMEHKALLNWAIRAKKAEEELALLKEEYNDLVNPPESYESFVDYYDSEYYEDI